MALQGALAEAVREGKEVLTGMVQLDGSNPTTITTPFATIDAVAVQLMGSSAPGVGTSVLTVDFAPGIGGDGAVDLYAWKPTSATDSTLIASTGTEDVSYIIVGRRRK